MNTACLESLSKMTRIALYPTELSNCLMKSMEMESHGCLGKLLEVAVRPMPGCFGMFAHNTGLAEFNDEGPKIGPVVFMSNQI